VNAPILPPSLVVRNDGTVLQIATGFAFPFTIGGLPRIDVRMYDAHGFNVGVTYRGSERSAPWVTLYSLPGRPTDGLMDTFVDSEEELARTHDDLVVVSRRRFAVAFEGGRRALGMQVEVRGRRALDLPDTVPVRAWLVLLQTGGHYLKLRITCAEEHGRAGLRLLSDALREGVRPFLAVAPEAS